MTKLQRNLLALLVLTLLAALFMICAVATGLAFVPDDTAGGPPTETITITPGPAIRDMPLPAATR